MTEVTREWQAAADPAVAAGARVCVLRTAPVMDRAPRPLKQLRLLFQPRPRRPAGRRPAVLPDDLAARLGRRRRRTSPSTPPPAGRSTSAARRRRPTPSSPRRWPGPSHRPAFLAVPGSAISLGAGRMAPELLGSLNVRPDALEDAGYRVPRPRRARGAGGRTGLSTRARKLARRVSAVARVAFAPDDSHAGRRPRPTTETPPPPSDPDRTVDWRRLRGPVAVVGARSPAPSVPSAPRSARWSPAASPRTPAPRLVAAARPVRRRRRRARHRRPHRSGPGVVDRAEGRLRADLLDAALHQPLAALTEQAVGEVLDRVDDDTHEVGALLRAERLAGDPHRCSPPGRCGSSPASTWWPAFFLFPLAGRRRAAPWSGRCCPQVSARKVERGDGLDRPRRRHGGGRRRAATTCAPASARPTCVRRCTELAGRGAPPVRDGAAARGPDRPPHRHAAARRARRAPRWSGSRWSSTTGSAPPPLVTLFLVTTMFVGQVDQLARHLPDLQAGLGAVLRLRELLGAEREPGGGADAARRAAGRAVPRPALRLRRGPLRARSTSTCSVPAGTTCALVGRTGSGKSTLASLLSRAVEPERGTVLLGGVDVLDLDLQQLRAAVGVVTQRTEILAGTLAENITLFADRPARRRRARGRRARPRRLGRRAAPRASTPCSARAAPRLSAGEEQLVAFARLLVRDVQVVVLDEATARMDPVTEAHVVRAAERLLAGRTGILVAHRLSTTERAEQVAVLDGGRVVQHGPARPAGRRARCRSASLLEAVGRGATPRRRAASAERAAGAVGTARRTGEPPAPPELRAGPEPGPRDPVGAAHRAAVGPGRHRRCSCVCALTGAFGAITGWIWGHLVVDPAGRRQPVGADRRAWSVSLHGLAAAARRGVPPLPALVGRGDAAGALRRARSGRPRSTGSTRTPPGRGRRPHHGRRPAGPVRRPLGRLRQRARDRRGHRARRRRACWPAACCSRVMVASALASSLGRRVAGRSAAASAAARARFGRSLVSALDSVRTVKLAASTPERARPPARGRRRPRRRRGPRAPGAGDARRRPDRDGAVRRRRGLGRPAWPAAGAWPRRCWSPARSTASTGSAGSPAR